MPDYRTFKDREARSATWAERKRERSSTDVWYAPEQAPEAFWTAVRMAIDWSLHSWGEMHERDTGKEWARELSAHEGRDFSVRDAQRAVENATADPDLAMAAIELLHDVVTQYWGVEGFAERVNDSALRFRVAVQFKSGRFVPATSEHLQDETVRRVLLLFERNPSLADVDDLYRKAWDRALGGDPAGAITASASAVQEMLRAVGVDGQSLEAMAKSGATKGVFPAGVGQIILKLDAFREASDAHSGGTDEPELALLVLRIAGSLMYYLAVHAPAQ